MINWWKNLNGTDKILTILSIFMLLFVIAILVIFVITKDEPSTLITVIGGAVIVEILALAKLKTDKRKQEILEKDEKK